MIWLYSEISVYSYAYFMEREKITLVINAENKLFPSPEIEWPDFKWILHIDCVLLFSMKYFTIVLGIGLALWERWLLLSWVIHDAVFLSLYRECGWVVLSLWCDCKYDTIPAFQVWPIRNERLSSQEHVLSCTVVASRGEMQVLFGN